MLICPRLQPDSDKEKVIADLKAVDIRSRLGPNQAHAGFGEGGAGGASLARPLGWLGSSSERLNRVSSTQNKN